MWLVVDPSYLVSVGFGTRFYILRGPVWASKVRRSLRVGFDVLLRIEYPTIGLKPFGFDHVLGIEYPTIGH